MEFPLLIIFYGVIAWLIANQAKKRGFSWAKYFWINLLLGFIGWIITFFWWRTDNKKIGGQTSIPNLVSSVVNTGPKSSSPPSNALMVEGPGYFSHEVVGESFNMPAIRSLAQARGGPGEHSVQAVLAAEPGNKFDARAIKVTIDGKQVGHIAKAGTDVYHPLLAQVARSGRTLLCDARLFYGKGYDDDFVGSVNLDLPHDLALAVPANELPVGVAIWPTGSKVQVSLNPEATPTMMEVLSRSYQDGKVAVHCELRATLDDKSAPAVGVFVTGSLVGRLSPASAKKFHPVLAQMESTQCFASGVAAGNTLAVDLHLRMKKPEELSQAEISDFGIGG